MASHREVAENERSFGSMALRCHEMTDRAKLVDCKAAHTMGDRSDAISW